MKEETQRRIWKAIDGALEEAKDGKSREEVFAAISELLWFIQSVLNVASTPEKLKTVLDTVEEPSEDKLIMIEGVVAFVPKLVPRMIGKEIYAKAVELTKETPGRKRPISEEQYSEICDEVLSLVRVKCSLQDAKRRVASRHNVSLKTIDRIWSKRDRRFPRWMASFLNLPWRMTRERSPDRLRILSMRKRSQLIQRQFIVLYRVFLLRVVDLEILIFSRVVAPMGVDTVPISIVGEAVDMPVHEDSFISVAQAVPTYHACTRSTVARINTIQSGGIYVSQWVIPNICVSIWALRIGERASYRIGCHEAAHAAGVVSGAEVIQP